jgi:hypothetical protein
VVATLVPVKMSISDVLPGLGGAGFGEVALSTALVRAFWRALRSLGAVTTKSTRRLPHRAQTSRFVPIGDRHLGAVAPGHFGWVRFDLVPAIETSDDQTHACRSGVAQRTSVLPGWIAFRQAVNPGRPS